MLLWVVIPEMRRREEIADGRGRNSGIILLMIILYVRGASGVRTFNYSKVARIADESASCYPG